MTPFRVGAHPTPLCAEECPLPTLMTIPGVGVLTALAETGESKLLRRDLSPRAPRDSLLVLAALRNSVQVNAQAL